MTISRAALTVILACALLGACGTNGKTTPPENRSAADPWEPTNRRIDVFNTNVDKISLKPIAKGYRKVVPSLARRGISNFYANLMTPYVALNNLLQGKGGAGLSDIGRFVMNSSIGLLGILDVAAKVGLEQHNEDIGQTLAVWGVGDGPYVVIPFFGPNTFRDALALPFDFLGNPLYYYQNASVRDKLLVLQVIDLRTRLLNAERFLDESADPYITLRESYLQNRNYNVYDGNPPLDDFYDEFEDIEE
jgi:phospholipid-binding lipoprotein MlaA